MGFDPGFQRTSPSRGFTLVEVIVVVSIIALLMLIGIPVMRKMSETSKINSTRSVVRAVAMAIANYPSRAIRLKIASGSLAADSLYPLWKISKAAGGTNFENLDPDPVLLASLDGTANSTQLPLPTGYTSYSDWSTKVSALVPGYRGLVIMTGINLPKENLGQALQPLDAWRRPLGFFWEFDRASPLFGTAGCRVWSYGPKGINEVNWSNGNFVSGTDDIDSLGNN